MSMRPFRFADKAYDSFEDYAFDRVGDVKPYLAKYADPTVAIQTAITDLSLAGGGTVMLPDDDYEVGGLSFTGHSVLLRGAGRNNTVLRLKTGANVPLITGSGSVSFFNGIADLTIDGNKSSQSNTSAHGVDMMRAQGWQVRNCHIKNTKGRGINIEGSSGQLSLDNDIYFNRIESTGQFGICFGNFSATVAIAFNIIGGTDDEDGIGIFNNDARVYGNHVHNGSRHGIFLDGGVNAQVHSNHVESCKQHGIALGSCTDAQVFLNKCLYNSRNATPNAFDGIRVTSAAVNPQVFLNHCDDDGKNTQRYGISVESGQATATVALNDTRTNVSGGIDDQGTGTRRSFNMPNDAFLLSGTGSPENVVTAPVGTLFARTDGGAGTTLYVKESGSGNTGWVAK